MTSKDKSSSSSRADALLGGESCSAKTEKSQSSEQQLAEAGKTPLSRAVSGSALDKFFESASSESWTQPNRGMDSNAVESLVFGVQNEPPEDALLLEFECSGSAAEVGGVSFIFEFDKVPQELVFSEFATYKLLKRKTRRIFYINGKNLESRIGLDNALYEQVRTRARKAFCVGEDIIAFESLRVST